MKSVSTAPPASNKHPSDDVESDVEMDEFSEVRQAYSYRHLYTLSFLCVQFLCERKICDVSVASTP